MHISWLTHAYFCVTNSCTFLEQLMHICMWLTHAPSHVANSCTFSCWVLMHICMRLTHELSQKIKGVEKVLPPSQFATTNWIGECLLTTQPHLNNTGMMWSSLYLVLCKQADTSAWVFAPNSQQIMEFVELVDKYKSAKRIYQTSRD